MIMKHLLLTFTTLIIGLSALRGQVGGDHVFNFLNLSPSARVSALGGNLITVMDDDVNLALGNPSLLNEQMHQQLGFNHNFHLASIGTGYAGYGHHAASINTTFHAGVQYVSYGEMDRTDQFGQVQGTFKANEYALTLGAGRKVDERLYLGANLKFLTAQLEGFSSTAIAGDVAATYRDTASRFLATLVFKNMGAQLSTFQPGARESLPFEVQFGISKRLRYLPFRFSVIYRNAQQWNVSFDDPNSEEDPFLFGQDGTSGNGGPTFVDNLFRHFVFNGEFLFGQTENFRIRLGYNHLLRQELSVADFGSLAGFSFGAGVKINRFRIDYGRQIYHLAGGVNHLSIATNLREFR